MTKISDLTALTGAGVDTAADLVPVVDMSETGAARNKKMTFAEVFAALAELVDDRVDGLLVAGSNVTLTYDDGAGTLTIAASTPSTGDITGFNEAVDDRVAALLQEGAGVSMVYDDTAGTFTIASTANALNGALPLTFNFTAAGDAYFYADVAMTLTEQATTGAGTVSYEKGTTADPDTFTATTSPITLQAGAWLKVSSDDALAVHLKRTA
jgi:hypothetical protein